MIVYAVLLALTAAERVLELVVSLRNARWSFSQGGKEVGREHYPWMVALHTSFLVGCAVEPWWLERSFVPAIGVPCLILSVGCQLLRWWCITTLGPQWNTRVIIVPGLTRITGGPYRWFNHPNYVAVVIEGVVLPLVGGAWITALAFTWLNALLLMARIRVENRALAELAQGTR